MKEGHQCIRCIYLGLMYDYTNDCMADACFEAHNIGKLPIPYQIDEENDCSFFED